ncbi:MAG: ABC transporter ATP-binding protein [Kiritimatiellaeota bacterium]|nr:ABC transporter ATP-binding protein [Kiritimatiellota bacterium]
MIQAEDLVKWFGPKLAVDHVSLNVKPGEVLGFLGPNGAGKSTTMRLITGFLPPSEGKIAIGGHDMENDGIAARSLIGYLPENAPAYPEMTVAGFLGFSAEIRGLRGRQKKEAVTHAVEICCLEPVYYQTIETLSKGYLHRTCFAQAILHDPPVLIMDEPTDGLDPNQKHEVRNLIKRMGQQENKAIIISTHILEEVDAVCSRVVIINQGRIVFSGGPDELRTRSRSSGAVTIAVRGVSESDLKESLTALPNVDSVAILAKNDGRIQARAFPARKDGKPDLGTARAVAALLREKNWEFEELHTEKGRLDEVFRAITISETPQKEGAE